MAAATSGLRRAAAFTVAQFGVPIVIRDLRAGQRNPRLAAATLGAVALLSMSIVIGVIAVVSGGAADPEFLGQVLVQIVYWAGVLVVVGAFPGMASVPLVAERERRSLDLVQMSQLSPLALAVGTATAALTNGFLILAALLPPLVLALVFGGVPWWVVAEMVYVITLTGVLASALGTHASAVSKTTVRAVLQGYFAALLLPGLLCTIAGGMFGACLEMQAMGRWDPTIVDVSVLLLAGGTVAAVALGLLALLLARNALLPPGGNRATPLRWYMLALFAWWAGGGLWFLRDLPRRFGAGGAGVDHEAWRAFGTALILLLWLAAFAMTVAFATEDPPGRRVERRAAGWRGWRRPAVLWFPGAERGAWFAIVVGGAALLGPAILADAFEAGGGLGGPSLSASYRSGGVLTLIALGAWAQLVAVAGVATCARALLGNAMRARAVVGGGVLGLQILANVGVAWSAATTGQVSLGVWNGSLVSLWTLCHGAWAMPGQLDARLDPVLEGVAIPFPFLFAALHLVPGVLLLVLAGVWRPAPRPAGTPPPAPEPAPA